MIGLNRAVWTLRVPLLVLLLSACGEQVPATESMPEPASTEPASAPEPTATEPASTPEPLAPVPSPAVASTEGVLTSQPTIPSPPHPGLEPLIEKAKEDLAQRISVPIEQISVLEAKAVVWPDASLGCPKPGMSYIQVLQEGALLRLLVGPFQYEYHSGEDQSPFLCDQFSPGSKTTEPVGVEPLPLNPPND